MKNKSIFFSVYSSLSFQKKKQWSLKLTLLPQETLRSLMSCFAARKKLSCVFFLFCFLILKRESTSWLPPSHSGNLLNGSLYLWVFFMQQCQRRSRHQSFIIVCHRLPRMNLFILVNWVHLTSAFVSSWFIWKIHETVRDQALLQSFPEGVCHFLYIY